MVMTIQTNDSLMGRNRTIRLAKKIIATSCKTIVLITIKIRRIYSSRGFDEINHNKTVTLLKSIDCRSKI